MKIKNNFDREYNEKFGEPTTGVYNLVDYLNWLDRVIDEDLEEDFDKNTKYNLLVDDIVATRNFEKAIKALKKDHNKEVLEQLKDVIIKLGRKEITTQKSNHPLKDAQGHLDLHLEGGNLVLIYKYIRDNAIELDVLYSTLLKLQDIVDHKELKRYNKKNFASKTRHFNIDSLDEGLNMVNKLPKYMQKYVDEFYNDGVWTIVINPEYGDRVISSDDKSEVIWMLKQMIKKNDFTLEW